MIDKRTVFEIHMLKNMGWSNRKIAQQLLISRPTIRKYLNHPEIKKIKPVKKASKLAPYYELINQFLEQDPYVKAPVVLQRLQDKGFEGKITIVRDFLKKVRGRIKYRKPFIRFESQPGEQMQIDWGHFGSLNYRDTPRKLYALAVIECHSRMLYVEFTHSQRQEVLHRALVNAFTYFGGVTEKIIVDNMVTAVIERQGAIIRFNEAFLDFLRIFNMVPEACNIKAPHEKGKIESSIKYLRQNFWPLRTFANLDEVNHQARKWLDTVANIRVHQTTGQRPVQRLDKAKLKPMPDLLPDCRETETLKVHKDFAVRFDGNTYSTPPWAIGKHITLKADQKTVTIFYKDKKIATHHRCWQRQQRIETSYHRQQVKRLQRKLWLDKDIAAFSSLGTQALEYLQAIVNANLPIKKNVTRLLSMKDEYGATSVIYAIKKALVYNAIGADYIENILYQEMTPQKNHPPVRLKNKGLNKIRLPEPSLAEYDVHVLKERNKK